MLRRLLAGQQAMQARIETLEHRSPESRVMGSDRPTGAFAEDPAAERGLSSAEVAEIVRSVGPAPSLGGSESRRRSTE